MSQTTLIIDVTDWINTGAHTGIQRVLKEFLFKAMQDNNLVVETIYFEQSNKNFFLLSSQDIKKAMRQTYSLQQKFCFAKTPYTFDNTKAILLEIDRVWNESSPRNYLYKELADKGICIINLVYDLIPVLRPNYFYEQTKKNFPSYMESILSYSHGVIFNSFNTQKDFYRLYHNHRRFDKIEQFIVSLGADITIKNTKNEKLQYGDILNKQYILFVGTLEPRKKHLFVLKAFEKIHCLFPDLHLVFIGKVGWGVEETIEFMKNHPLKNKKIFHFPSVTDKGLIHFYQKAFIVCYLSDYEGYGLPVVESLYYGNVTFVSKNSSLLELAPKLVEFIENEEEFIDKISRYLTFPNFYKDKKKSLIKKSQKKSWNNFYLQIVKILSSCRKNKYLI